MNSDDRRGDYVVVDTSALYALISSNDRFHTRARNILQELLDGGSELWVCSYVLAEFGAIVKNRFGFKPLETFLDSQKELLQVIWVVEALHTEAWAEFAAREGIGPNFVDWVVIVAAKYLRARIFTFDSDFESVGADVMPPSGR